MVWFSRKQPVVHDVKRPWRAGLPRAASCSSTYEPNGIAVEVVVPKASNPNRLRKVQKSLVFGRWSPAIVPSGTAEAATLGGLRG